MRSKKVCLVVALLAVVMFCISACTTHTDLHVQSSNDQFGNQTIDLHRDTDLKSVSGNSTK